MGYKTSKKVDLLERKYQKMGYKINQTRDSLFLSRTPQGNKSMKRIGKKLGTGGGSGSATTVFAYKDLKKVKG